MRKPTAVGAALFFSFLVAAASLGLVFYARRSIMNEAEGMVQELSDDAHLAALRAARDDAQTLLQRLNTSTSNLAMVLGSGFSAPSLPSVNQQVFRPLFLVYTAFRPMVSQVTFFQEDGFLYSYYDEGNGTTRVLFSNTTTPSRNTSGATPCYYSQAVDEDTGDPVGSAVASTVPCNATGWLDDAFAYGDGAASLGSGWVGDEEPVLLFTAMAKAAAALSRRTPQAVLSLGFPLQVLVNSIQGRGAHGGDLFFATANGHILRDGGHPSAHILLNNGTVSIHVQNPKPGSHFSNKKQEEEEEFVLPCRADGDSSEGTLLGVGGQPFKFYCTSLDTAGMSLVFVLAFPHMFLTSHVHTLYTMASFLLLSFLSVVLVASVLILQWTGKYERRVTFLYSSLIKQKEATQQAERKSMNKSLAFASASHDVRTCLAGITGLIELCQSEASPQSEREKNLDQMKICASKLLGILNSVLDTSKVEAGKMQLEEVEFNVAEVIEESIDIFHVVAWKRGIEMIWDPCDNFVLNSASVKGDPRRLKQILDNLLSNAIKFTCEGHVLVRAWAKKSHIGALTSSHNYAYNFSIMPSLLSCFSYGKRDVFDDHNSPYPGDYDSNFVEFVFEVDDTGIGIPKDRRESVFENYVQVKESINEQEGTGLGLGIVQSYVRLMGGEINIIDKGPSEKGTCFRFNIFLKSLETIDERVDIISHDREALNELPNSSAAITNSKCGYHNTNQSKCRAMTLCKALKHDAIHVLLLIHGEETRRISKRWFESLGVKVWVVDQWELLAPTLERIEQKLSFAPFNIFERSHSMTPGIQSDMPTTQTHNDIETSESSKIKDELNYLSPLSMPIYELHGKTSLLSTSLYTLILIDMSFGSLHDAHFALNAFIRSINHYHCKVVWLANSDTPTTELKTLRNKEVPCDLILHKPFHGSRLHAVLKLLQEFGEPMGDTTDTTVDDMIPEDTSDPDYSTDKPLYGMKVLVVEDNVVLRHLTSTTLSHLGASVELSENGKDAVNLIRKILREESVLDNESMEKQHLRGVTRHSPFDIILMDCEMPIMNGYEATEQIRIEEKQYGLHTPIIALTAHSMAEQEIDFAQAGMDSYLMKPLRADMLLDAINKIKKKN